MAYTKQTWENLPSQTTPINADRLTHIEDGIFDAAATADTAASNASSAISGLADKVDKVEGKGLSANDFTDTLKTKLDNIESGAEVNVQADYAQTDTTADDYIKNKPSFGTSAYKNSTSVVTDSTDLVESGAVFDAIQAQEQLLKDTVGWDGNNKCVYPYRPSLTFPFSVGGGITYTADGTNIFANGTSTSGNELALYTKEDTANTLRLSVGKYVFSGRPNIVNNKIAMYVGTTKDDAYYEIARCSSGTEVEFEITNDLLVSGKDYASVSVYINIYSGVTADNLTFTPQIKRLSVDKVKADNSVIGTVEDGTNPTKAYAVGEHFIRNGKFCTCTVAVTTSSTWTLGSNYVEGDVADSLVYKAGNSISVNTNTAPMMGYVTSGATEVYCALELPREIIASTLTISNLGAVTIRGIGGYVVNNDNTIVVSLVNIIRNRIAFKFKKNDSTAFTVTNNTPVTVDVAFTITFA